MDYFALAKKLIARLIWYSGTMLCFFLLAVRFLKEEKHTTEGRAFGMEPQPSRRRMRVNLNLFGRVFYMICKRLGTNSEGISRAAGVDQGTLSKNTRMGKHQILRVTLDKVYGVMSRYPGWSPEWKPLLYHSAGYATEEEIEAARLAMQKMERNAKPPG